MEWIQTFVGVNRALCNRFDALLPEKYQKDGNQSFTEQFVPRFVSQGLKVYDVGGGRHPFFSPDECRTLGLEVVGIDISEEELMAAPAGAYQCTYCEDITRVEGPADGDLILCRTLLEHVVDVEAALQALASLCSPEGRILVFVPNRNAAFARLNRALPEDLKRRLLFTLFPHAREGQGFRSYYDRCTPADFHALSARHGLKVEDEQHFFRSDYFSFFLPLHLLWRSWSAMQIAIARGQASETFVMELRRHAASVAAPGRQAA